MENEQHTKWLKRTEELFLRYGIKSLTMDDVARELGISKKTLYQFVENKNDLVNKVMDLHLAEDQSKTACIAQDAANAIEEMLQLIQYTQEDFQRMKANVLYDLQKYHYDAWVKTTEQQRGFLLEMARLNLERGISEGLYRTSFDLDTLARIHVSNMFALLDESWFPRPPYTLDRIFREYLIFYLHSIVSDKGRFILNAKLS